VYQALQERKRNCGAKIQWEKADRARILAALGEHCLDVYPARNHRSFRTKENEVGRLLDRSLRLLGGAIARQEGIYDGPHPGVAEQA
jgi:hypothetical protein